MKHLLSEEAYKNIIAETLQFLVQDNRVRLFSFCIMNNHVHFIWQPLQNYNLTQVQSSFMRSTAKQIMKKLSIEKPEVLESLKVKKHDRRYQIWKREPLTIELFTDKAFMQKLDYIHNNPVSAGIVLHPEDYKYSSAKFYEFGIDEFNMISHYSGN